MKTMTGFYITGLTLQGFRNQVTSVHFDCGSMTLISGHNGTGKTTMAHAICYALYGVNFYGEQKIERLMNEKGDSVKVQLEFADQDGEAHTLLRSRAGDKTTLTLDGYTVQQTAIERMFGEKDAFLSVFNPLYLPEYMGNAGRELLLRYCQPVSKEDVLKALPNYRAALENLPLETQPPEELLKETRADIRRAEQQCDVLTGHFESAAEARKTAGRKLDELYAEKQTLGEEIERLKARQFEGIDIEEIARQRKGLKSQLAHSESTEMTAIRQALSEAKGRVYGSRFQKSFAEAQAEYTSLGEQYKSLAERIKTAKSGEHCPACHRIMTEEDLAAYKANLTAECGEIAQKGKGAKERLREIAELDKKAKEQFEQYKEDDIRKLTEELAGLTAKAPDREQIAAELSRLEELESVGNLDEQEVSRLRELEATLIGVTAQINAFEESTSEEKLQALLAEKDAFEEQIRTLKQTVSALTEYLFKRAELASGGFSMPNVSVRLFDVMRSTGEVKSTFQFSYKGRDYRTLSLSEKTLAGMELAALMRQLTGKDYPICIDNTESIAAFGDAELPSQVFMLRVAKGQPLTVKAQSGRTERRAA